MPQGPVLAIEVLALGPGVPLFGRGAGAVQGRILWLLLALFIWILVRLGFDHQACLNQDPTLHQRRAHESYPASTCFGRYHR